MTPDQLRAELQSGKSLAQIAQAKGVSRDTLKAKMLEAQKARLDAPSRPVGSPPSRPSSTSPNAANVDSDDRLRRRDSGADRSRGTP